MPGKRQAVLIMSCQFGTILTEFAVSRGLRTKWRAIAGQARTWGRVSSRPRLTQRDVHNKRPPGGGLSLVICDLNIRPRQLDCGGVARQRNRPKPSPGREGQRRRWGRGQERR
jgi:hypothetical protein